MKRVTLTPDQIPEFIDRVFRDGKRDTELAIRATATALHEAVVYGTRVDTGAARSNWVASIGFPQLSPIEPYVPGKRGSTAGDNAIAALAQGQKVIDRYRYGQVLYVTNCIPYILKLNSGSATNSPDLMFEKGLQTARLAFRSGKFRQQGLRMKIMS